MDCRAKVICFDLQGFRVSGFKQLLCMYDAIINSLGCVTMFLSRMAFYVGGSVGPPTFMAAAILDMT